MRAVVLCVLISLAGADVLHAQAEGHRILIADSTTVSEVDLTEDLFSWSPAICGGTFDVLIEPLRIS